MAIKSKLELYAAVVLPRLAAGPMTAAELGVPGYALERLESQGVVAGRNYNVGSVVVRAWFLPEHADLLPSEPARATKFSCDDPNLWAGIPEDE